MAKQAKRPTTKLPGKFKILLFLTLLQVSHSANILVHEEPNFSQYIIPTSIVSQGNAKAPQFIEIASKFFSSIYTRTKFWECRGACWTLKKSKQFQIFLEFNSRSNDFQDDISFTQRQILPQIFIDTFVLYAKQGLPILPEKYIQLQKISKGDNTIACSFLHTDITTPSEAHTDSEYSNENECSLIFNYTTVQIWRLKFNMEIIEEKISKRDNMSESVFKRVENVFKERDDFLKNNPRKKVLLHFDITNWNTKTFLTDAGMYCSENKLAIYEFFESLAKKAADRKIPVIFNSIMGDTLYPEWIGAINPPPGVEVYNETFYPVIRNYPPLLSRWLGKDECVKKTKKIPANGIPFNKSLSGVTFDVNVRSNSLSVQEAKVMLEFVMHKFTRVELKLGKEVESVKSISAALNLIFEKGDMGNNGFFVEVNLPNIPSLRNQYLEEVGNLIDVIEKNPSSTFLGVHGYYDNNKDKEFSRVKSSENIVTVLRAGLKSNVKIGISLATCASQLEHLLETSRAEFSTKVEYVICNGENVKSSENEWNSEQYLDGFLVVQKAFKKLDPNLEIHFKIDISGKKGLRFKNLPMEEKQRSEHILCFIGDVGKFSDLYQMSYFLSPAFGDVRNQQVGWWKITNYDDLSRADEFIEKEAQIPHWKRLPKEPEPVKEPVKERVKEPVKDPGYDTGKDPGKDPLRDQVQDSHSLGPPVFWITGVIALLAIISGNICYCRRMRKTTILTTTEVEEFSQGKTHKQGDIAMAMNDYMSAGFDLKHKIQKVELKEGSSEVLGCGNFGTVYKAKVKESICAIKIPNHGCSKESFKSMLTEVKLMSYIGGHVNIIQFVGAYTDEIKNGVIQIATTVCANGSLLSHLRSVKGGVDVQKSTLEFCRLFELIKFSREIASGMSYIAEKHVVHGDLSTRNVLLDGNNTCKIADFGLSRKLYEYNKYVKKSQEPLPWRWMSYESLTQLEFTTKSDIWSYGVTLWEIFTLGDIPFPGLTWSPEFTNELLNGMRMPMPMFAPPEIRSKLSDCWNIDPRKRPEFEEMTMFIGTLNTDYTVLDDV